MSLLELHTSFVNSDKCVVTLAGLRIECNG